MKYYVDLPYPKIQVERPNIKYAKILSDVYAGEISEDTCIHLYIFEHIVLKDTYSEYSKILKEIAIVEMHHLDMLGRLIRLLGLEPLFVSYKIDKIIPWNSNYIKYNTNIKDMIDIDIKSEENAIKCYQNIISIINDKYVIEIIKRIILDEELHIKIFKDIKSKLN